MKISYFNYHYNIRGSARGAVHQVETIAKHLRGLGHEVNVHYRAARKYTDEETGTGSSGEKKGLFGWLKQFSFLRRILNVPKMFLRNIPFKRREKELIRADDADVVLAVSSYVNYSAQAAARACKVPFVLFCDGPMHYEYSLFWKQYTTYSWLGRHIERLNLRRADQVTTISEIFKGYLVNYGIPADKITVVPNGVDADAVRPQEKDAALLQQYGLENATVAGFIGSFNFFDDVEKIVGIIERLMQRFPHLRFLFVGKGKAGDQLAAALTEKGLEERVIFTGALPHQEAMRHLTLMDVVFSPYLGNYLFYGSSMKIMEYMAAGKAVIATALGQIRELILNGHNGLLFDWGDYETLEKHFISAVENEELRRDLGRNARETILSGWTWEQQVKKLEKVLVRAAKS